MSVSNFRATNTLAQRKSESARRREKYPNKVPIICEVSPKKARELKLEKNKYLVPGDFTIGQFLMILRRRINITPEKALFLFMEDSTMPPTGELLVVLDANNKNEDGFLYITVSLDNTFG